MAEQEYLVVEYLSTVEIANIFGRIIVDSLKGCWLWNGGTLRRGYGVLVFRGRPEYAHRILYAWLVEPAPKRKAGQKTPHLDHVVCDNPLCCNPAHLKLVTPRENILRSNRGVGAANARKTHCIHGHLLRWDGRQRRCVECPRERFRNMRKLESYRTYHREYMRQWTAKHRENKKQTE